jgi:Glycosyl hydrolase family 20, catalytic domain
MEELPFLFGVMVDGGRHNFPPDWLEFFMQDVHKIGLNALHFTVAHDERFNLALDNATTRIQRRHATNNIRHDDVPYTQSDWKSIVALARTQNMTIVPEISVPIYAASWANVFGSDILANCPQYICGAGYGIPLNVHHPNLRNVLRQVFGYLVDVLERPPLLHLGSNDITLAEPCWKEAAERFRREHPALSDGLEPTSDYGNLEESLEQILIRDLGYSPEQVIRQENMDKPRSMKAAKITGLLSQYKNHEHALGQEGLYILQPNQLNLAINAMDRVSGWDFYQQTLEIIENHWSTDGNKGNTFRGLLISTEAMDANMIRQRNVLGRLLAISMAVRDAAVGRDTGSKKTHAYGSSKEFEDAYLTICEQLFSDEVPKTIATSFCSLHGGTFSRISSGSQEDINLIPTDEYKTLYSKLLNDMKDDLCERLTEMKKEVHLQGVSGPIMHQIQNMAFARYWHSRSVGNEPQEPIAESEFSAEMLPQEDDRGDVNGEDAPKSRRRHTHREGTLPPILHEAFKTTDINRRGIIVDMVGNPSSRTELEDLMKSMVSLGLNTMQLSLLNELGCALQLGDTKLLYHIVPTPKDDGIGFSDKILGQVVRRAANFGIELIPEISVTTRSTGWYHAGFLVDCPMTLCHTGEISNDVTRGSLLPVLIDMVRTIYRFFHTSSPYLHLGSDERDLSMQCWNESGRVPDYSLFESKLSEMLREKGWYNPSKILRWENKEGIQYMNRTGEMTHYQYSIPTESRSSFFGSFVIDNTTNPWAVYSKTRDWVASKPEGLLAKIPKISLNDVAENKPNLIAFAAGMSSSLPLMKNKRELDDFFSEICEKHTAWCKLPPVSKGNTRGKEPSRRDALCKSMTHSSTATVMRMIPSAVALDTRVVEA